MEEVWKNYIYNYDISNLGRLRNNKTGNMYVLLLTISNIFQGKLDDDEKLPQTYFVIVEKNYNDYEMSFSVNDVE